MKGHVWFEQGARQHGEMLTFVSLGIAGIVMILFAVSAMIDLVAARDQVAITLSSKLPVEAEGTTIAPFAVNNPGERPGGAVVSPAQTTNATAVCSPRAAVAVDAGLRRMRAVHVGWTTRCLRVEQLIDY